MLELIQWAVSPTIIQYWLPFAVLFLIIQIIAIWRTGDLVDLDDPDDD